MNLDELISKYLDSELSPAEDELLRSIISLDEAAHEKFDSAVALHMAFREDALSIETPEELVRETEDAILMKILKEAPAEKKRLIPVRRIPSLAGLVAVFLLLFVFNIDDMQILNKGEFASDQAPESKVAVLGENEENKNSNETIENETGTIADVIEESNTSNESDNSNIYAGADNSISLSNSNSERSTDNPEISRNAETFAGNISEYARELTGRIEDYTSIEEPVVDNVIIARNDNTDSYPEITHSGIPTFNASDNILSDRNFKRTDPHRYGMSENIGFNGLESLLKVDEVQVTSFFATDVFRGGMDCKDEYVVSHVSQSIAYSLDQDSRLGLELGYSEYTYNENVTIPISAYPGPDDGSMVEVVDPVSGAHSYINVPVTIDRQKQMFWGTAFYERSLYDRNSLSLQGRLGLGLSADGMLSFARLFAKYELVSGLFLTAGGEFRMFNAELQILNGETMGLKTSASLVYGFQLRF